MFDEDAMEYQLQQGQVYAQIGVFGVFFVVVPNAMKTFNSRGSG